MTDEILDARILVTPTSIRLVEPRLVQELESRVREVIYNPYGRPLRASEVAELLPGVDGYIAGLDEITAEALKGADRLKVIARYGVGLDNVDLEAARARGIVVTHTVGANAISVAELTIGLMLALMRRIPSAVEQTRRGEWPRIRGLALYGKTVGLIGLGAIGREVARRLLAFGCRVLVYDPYVDTGTASQFGTPYDSLEQLLPLADVVSLHVPATPATVGMVDAAFLGRMKRGALLVNTSRGELIDYKALLEALRSDHLAGAALDVYPQEPPDPDDPLLRMPQVLVTPHMGAHTDDAIRQMFVLSVADCLAVLRGEPPRFAAT
ncbi:MAG: phosphoglycerate dehydrogenase [Anaerolineae bacterium]